METPQTWRLDRGTPPKVRIGVDIGQQRDPTAFAIVEYRPLISANPADYGDPFGYRPEPPRRLDHIVRHLERLPLGTPYPDVAAEIVNLVDSVNEWVDDDLTTPDLLVDVTGVGRPVFDLIRAPLQYANVRPLAVTFTGTDRAPERGQRHDELRIGKSYLAARLKVLAERGRIFANIEGMYEADPATGLPRGALDDELRAYIARMNTSGHTQIGAFAGGAHDDLVTALVLALALPYQAGRSTTLIDL